MTKPSASVPSDTLPSLRFGTATARYGGSLLLGHESTANLAAFPPVAALMVEAFDGSTRRNDLVDDLADALQLDPEEALQTIRELETTLDQAGFIESGPLPAEHVPRRRDVPIPPRSCLASRWGLSRSRTIQVQGNDGFRISSTDHAVLDHVERILAETEALEPPDDTYCDQLHLRVSIGRTPRLQQVFDTMDMRWFASRDHAAAVEAFHRSIEARLLMRSGGAWFHGPSFRNDSGIVLAHPSLWGEILSEEARRGLADVGIIPSESGLMHLDDRGLVMPGERFGGRPERTFRLTGWLVPAELGEVDAALHGMHLLRWWDTTSFEAAAKHLIPSRRLVVRGRSEVAGAIKALIG